MKEHRTIDGLIDDECDSYFAVCKECLHAFEFYNPEDLGETDSNVILQTVLLNDDKTSSELVTMWKLVCPRCSFCATYYPEEVQADTKDRIKVAAQMENAILRDRLSKLKILVLNTMEEKRLLNRRYRKARKEVRKLADSFHLVDRENEESEESDTFPFNKDKKKTHFEKKDFVHYR